MYLDLMIYDQLRSVSIAVLDAFSNECTVEEIRSVVDDFRSARAQVISIPLTEKFKDDSVALKNISKTFEVEKKAGSILQEYQSQIKRIIDKDIFLKFDNNTCEYLKEKWLNHQFSDISLCLDTVIPPVWNFKLDLLILNERETFLIDFFKNRGQERILILRDDEIHEEKNNEILTLPCNSESVSENELIGALSKYRFNPPKRWLTITDEESIIRKNFDLIKDTIDSMAIYQNTAKNYSETWIKNEIQNSKYIYKSNCVSQLKKIFENQNVLIASPGPSLANEIRLLRDYKENFIILCPLQTFPALYREGITPDYVLSIDPIDFTQHLDLSGIQECRGLICTEASHPNTMALTENLFTLFTTKQTLGLHEIINGEELDLFGSSVSVLASDLVSRLGAKTICLIGQDLILGKETYFGLPAAYNSTIVTSEKTLNWNGQEVQAKFLRAKDGSLCITRPDFYNFHYEFEYFSKNHSYSTFLYNATSTGADIQGFKNIKLCEFFELCQNSNLEKDTEKFKISETELAAREKFYKDKVRNIKRKLNFILKITHDSLTCLKKRKPNFVKNLNKNEKDLKKLLENERLFDLYLMHYIQIFSSQITNIKSFEHSLELTKDLHQKVFETSKHLKGIFKM